MPKAPSAQEVAIPQGRGARRSVPQEELMEALEMLRRGEGVEKDGFLVLELEQQKSVGSARSALWNLRWKFNPDNPESKEKDGKTFKELFKDAGRGAIQVYAGPKRADGTESVLIAVPVAYAKK